MRKRWFAGTALASMIGVVWIVGLVALALVSVFAAPRPAAAQETPPWVQLTIVQVDPAMVDEFIAVQREFMARAKEAGTPWRSVSRTVVFGDTYRFLIATPVENFASFDDANDPDPELTALTNRVQKCITSRQSYAVRTLPDIDNPLPEDEPPDLMVVNVATVVPGREQDYLRVMTTDFLPHFDEAEVHGGYYRLIYVGSSLNEPLTDVADEIRARSRELATQHLVLYERPGGGVPQNARVTLTRMGVRVVSVTQDGKLR